MEPYRPRLDLESMAPEARDVVERTEQMLIDLDSHAGRFAELTYDSAPTILDHPSMRGTNLSRAEVWNTLERERLSLICGYPVPPEHALRYAYLRAEAHRWIEHTGYRRPVLHSAVGKFPLLKTQISYLQSLFAEAGMENVQSQNGGGYSTIEFKFPAAFFGHMLGQLEIKIIHTGEARFTIASGARLSGDVVFRATHRELLGAGHYIRFGLEPPEGMVFTMRPDEPGGKLDQAVGLMVSIASYFRPKEGSRE